MRYIVVILAIININLSSSNVYAINNHSFSDSSYRNFLFIYKKNTIERNDVDDFKKNLIKSFDKRNCNIAFMEYSLLSDSIFLKQLADTVKEKNIDFIIALQNFTEQSVIESGPRQLEALRFKKIVTTKRRDYSFVGYKAGERPYKQVWKCNCNRIDFIMYKLSVKQLAKCLLSELENGQIVNLN